MNASARQQGRSSGTRRHDRHQLGRSTVRSNAIARLAGYTLVSVAAIVVVLSLVTSPERPEPLAWSAISVDHTGTLWQIAAENAVDGLSVSETVDLIREENGLSSSTLYAGQTLVVPVNTTASLSLAQR